LNESIPCEGIGCAESSGLDFLGVKRLPRPARTHPRRQLWRLPDEAGGKAVCAGCFMHRTGVRPVEAKTSAPSLRCPAVHNLPHVIPNPRRHGRDHGTSRRRRPGAGGRRVVARGHRARVPTPQSQIGWRPRAPPAVLWTRCHRRVMDLITSQADCTRHAGKPIKSIIAAVATQSTLAPSSRRGGWRGAGRDGSRMGDQARS